MLSEHPDGLREHLGGGPPVLREIFVAEPVDLGGFVRHRDVRVDEPLPMLDHVAVLVGGGNHYLDDPVIERVNAGCLGICTKIYCLTH